MNTPDSPTPATQTPQLAQDKPRAGIGRILIQLLGFGVCIGLLWWCVQTALNPANRDKLSRLADAPIQDVVLLFALSAASVLLNGSMFWLVLRPAKRIKFWDVQAVNGTASFLSYAPAKLSILYRILVHTRRDGVPLLTMGAWLAAMSVIVVAAMAPMIGLAEWRQKADAVFYVGCIVSILVLFTIIVLSARAFSGVKGLARIQSIFGAVPWKFFQRIPHLAAFQKLHAGFDMLASPSAVGGSLTIRVVDLLVQAFRFIVAAKILGETLHLDTAVMSACTFYLIGVTSPAGSLGAREGATTQMASWMKIPGLDTGEFAPIALTVSATEFVIFLTAAVLGILWIQPWKLLGGKRPAKSG
jgi:hypothetical protein